MPSPTSKKEMQAFIGTIGFLRMHNPEYRQIVSPLYFVTHKNSFQWDPEQQQAFEQLKQEITHSAALGWKKANLQPKGKPILAAKMCQDITAWVEKLIMRVRHVDAHVLKSRVNEEQYNSEQADQAARVKVSQVHLDWQHKGDLLLAQWSHDASGHQGRDATYSKYDDTDGSGDRMENENKEIIVQIARLELNAKLNFTPDSSTFIIPGGYIQCLE
ncbi:hypothetical protein BTVI_43398 [Pitangus sulphuratus]|nr:hypothetical protein BTVI_43398 [Pitangus sulphuratus]